MTIKDIQLTRTGNAAVLSAMCKIRKVGWDRVYFRVDAAQAENIYTDASPFAAALLLPSMRQGEDLIIHGSISRQLFDGMQTIMAEVLGWGIGLKPIKVKADAVVADVQTPTKTATFFSGGVDSFYTYLKHKNNPEADGGIDSFILIHGFDVDLRSQNLWMMTRQYIQEIADLEGVELIALETNMYHLIDPILPWEFAHGGALAAVALSLRGGFRKVYIPSTFAVEEQVPWGSHLSTDRYWSTEQTQFVHDGTEATRVNKVLWQIAGSPLALNYLRVCDVNDLKRYNCGVCDKCVRTMISLYAAGVLKEAVTFPDQVDPEQVARLAVVKREGEPIVHGEVQNLAALKARNLDPTLQAALQLRIDQTRAGTMTRKKKSAARMGNFIHQAVYFDHTYLHGYTFVVLSQVFGRKFS